MFALNTRTTRAHLFLWPGCREMESKLRDHEGLTPFSQHGTPRWDRDSDHLSDTSSATTLQGEASDNSQGSSSPRPTPAAARSFLAYETNHDRNMSSPEPSPPSTPPSSPAPELSLVLECSADTTPPKCGSKRGASFLQDGSQHRTKRVWPAPPPFPPAQMHVSRTLRMT